jgi:glycogen operon protein
MLQAGDERGRTQLGNNNAYCQDNATSWLDWTDSPDTAALTAFTRTLIELRSSAPVLRAARFPAPAQPCLQTEPTANTGLHWFNPDGTPMTQADWDRSFTFPFTLVLQDTADSPSVLVMFNAGWQDVSFTPPPSATGTWSVAVDTADTGTPAAPPTGAITPPITVTARSLIIARS